MKFPSWDEGERLIRCPEKEKRASKGFDLDDKVFGAGRPDRNRREVGGKMKRYVHTLLMAANRDAVLWVAPHDKRTRTLAECRERVQADPIYAPFVGEPGFYFPDMLFLPLEDVPTLIHNRKAQAM